MLKFAPSVRRRRLALALGTSTLACGLLLPVAVRAQCAPDPTQVNQTTICSGTDTDGVRLTTDSSTVNVIALATVNGLAAPAVTVDIDSQSGVPGQRTGTILVAGTVDGGFQSGIAVLSGTVPVGSFDFYGTGANVIVAAGAKLTGASAITAGTSPSNSYGQSLVVVDNAGTISGTGGVALLATDPARAGFTSITNAANGTIGAISGAVGILTNAGLIDGGTRSAIDQTTAYNGSIYPFDNWTNNGTIQSDSTVATIANLGQSQMLINSGTISNTGAGAAVEGNYLTISNLTGGQITSGGSTAIATMSAVTLTNSGTITGNVVANPAEGTGFYSTIDSTAGTINGNVTLGRGNDLIYARYVGTPALVTGITGTIDAGGGMNAVVLAPATDLTISTAVTLPTGIQRLRLQPSENSTLKLAAGFIAPGTIEVGGSGAIVNDAAIVTTGQAFVQPYYASSSAPTLTNNGSIQATVDQRYYAIDLQSGSSLTNAGTIDSTSNGVQLSSNALVNTGSIVAAQTTVSQFGGTLDNRGLIRSTGGIAVSLSGNTDNTPAQNSGRIEGATYGAIIGYALNNSGTIAATGTGTAVGLSNYGVLNNLTGGVISAGAYAITGSDPYGSTSVYNGKVFNAGTINGDVTFLSSRDYGSNNSNTYVALTGGVLNGNLSLGQGDTLVTDMFTTGTGGFAGINGTVTSSGSLLRYRVSGTANAVIAPVGPFATVGYELIDGAKLTLSASATQTLPIVLAGTGTVDLTANADVVNRAALSVTAAQNAGTAQPGTSGLNVISRGTLAGTIDNYFSGAFGVTVLGRADSLDNEGTIKAIYAATNGGDGFNAAVLYAASLTNNGRIELDGSYGTYGVAGVVNTGAIVQTGTRTSIGISGASTVINSGMIQTAGVAISGGYYGESTRITNSGSIVSTRQAAIGGGLSGSAAVQNLASGTIRGGDGTAISMAGGSVANEGTIIGDVDLQSFSGYQAAYFSNGGTTTGSLTLTSGDDLFLQGSDTTGVNGTITAGGGRDIYGRALSTSGSVAIGPAPAADFKDAMIAAFGSSTVATLTGVDASFANLYAVGDGTVVNQATLSGAVVTTAPTYAMRAVVGDGPLGSFTNTGSIAGGVSGAVTQFVNSGTIGSSNLGGQSVAIANQSTLSFTNSGLITASQNNGPRSSLNSIDALSFLNTGTIDNGLAAKSNISTKNGIESITAINTGLIRTSISGAALDISVVSKIDGNVGSVSVDNSGSITSDSAGAAVGLAVSLDGGESAITYAVRNSGVISAVTSATDGTAAVTGLSLIADKAATGTIVNSTAGSIVASSVNAVAVHVSGTTLTLDNGGNISANGTSAVAIKAIDRFANSVRNTGRITGSILLGDGNDRVENRGLISGDVSLGAGDDSFLAQASGFITSTVDGGVGTDTLILNATGGGSFNGDQFVNFERLDQVGAGNVSYTGHFRFSTIGFSGGSATVAAGQTLRSDGPITLTGSNAAEAVVNNGTIAGAVVLGGDNDRLVNAGVIGGSVLLGDGDDQFIDGIGSSVAGTIDGGGGNDIAMIELAGNRTLTSALTGFETLATVGTGQLSISGPFNIATVLSNTDLTVAAGGALTVNQVQFGTGDNRFNISGGFIGSIDGGAGNDTLTVSGGSEATPILFGNVSNLETYVQSGGSTQISGSAAFSALEMISGRLVGQAGSVITAPQIMVRQGATFGSAGTINGNIVVAGTLSPGASPGTMTVNGNVALAGGSTSLFELSSGVSDKLLVNGSVSIATGSTLQLVTVGTLRPGASYTLISATGGISGSYTTLVKPSDLFGFVIQRANEIQLLGEFVDTGDFHPQVSRSIAYTNRTLEAQASTSPLFGALPALLTRTGASNPQAFARLTPEPYASATQVGVNNALVLVDAARGPSFAATGERPHAYTFATSLGQWHRLSDDQSAGTSAVRTHGYGFLSGIGYGNQTWSVGAFGGYLNNRQHIDALAVHTTADGVVAGVQGRLHTASGFGLNVSVVYDGNKATTARVLPVGTANSRYGLHSWVSDLHASYEFGLRGDWAVKPQIGVTYLRTIRDGLAERGSSPFALTVARNRHVAGFADGALSFGRGEASEAALRPFVALGARYQIEGTRADALAGYSGGTSTLYALSAPRARLVGTAMGGVGYRLQNGIEIFVTAASQTGRDDHQNSVSAGAKFRF